MKTVIQILSIFSFFQWAHAAQSDLLETQYSGAEANRIISSIVQLEKRDLVEYISFHGLSTNESAVEGEHIHDTWVIFEVNLNGKVISCESHTYMSSGKITQDIPLDTDECVVKE